MHRAGESVNLVETGEMTGVTEPCPSCGESNTSTASECIACGKSLVFLASGSTAISRAPRTPAATTRSDASFWTGSGHPPIEEPLDYAPGETFASRYVIIDRLGQGGMGVVYKARDLELNRLVAIKMIRTQLTDDPESLERFRREPGLAQQVTHENVCRVHDLGVSDGVRYLSMEYLEANALSDLIAKLGRLSVRQTLEIVLQVADGLEAIHAQGIVHRDLKPSNIAVDAERRAVVMDFGLARGPIDSELTQPGVLVGSYAYLSPEHIRGEELTVAVDIYAIGLLLYEMLTGFRPPGDDDSRPLALRGEEQRCPPPSAIEPDVPREIDRLILRCLAWDPSRRPQSVSEIREVLMAALDHETARSSRRPRRRRPRGSSIMALAGTFIASTLGILWMTLAPPASHRASTVFVAPVTVEAEASATAGLGVLTADALEATLGTLSGFRLARNGGAGFTVGGAILDGSDADEDGELAWHLWIRDEDNRIVWTTTRHGKDPISVVEAAIGELVTEGLGASDPLPLDRVRSDHLEAYRHYLEGKALHDGWYAEPGRLDRARDLYQEALRLDPDFAAAHAGQAIASLGSFLETNDPGDRAVAQYASARAVAYGSAIAEAHLAQGMYRAGAGDWDGAAESFGRAFALAPDDDRSRRNVADLYDFLGRVDDARAMYESAIATNPDAWENFFGLGRFLFLNGRLDEAPAHLQRAAELNPDAHGPPALLGFSYLSAGDLASARTYYERALAIHDDVYARKRLGLVHYYAARYDRALHEWERVLAEAPQQGSAYTNVADALRQLGRHEEASELYREGLRLFDAALADDPDDGEQRALKALALAATHQCVHAGREVEAVLKDKPHNPALLYYGAVVSSRCRDIDRASELVLESIAAGNVVGARFDPDLADVREDPRIRRPLELIGLGTDD